MSRLVCEKKGDVMGFYDIHTHILPGIDDGSENMDMTIEMLKKQVSEGVTDIIATSHYDTHHNLQDYDRIKALTEQVREEAAKISENLTIYTGAEILYSRSIKQHIKEGKIHSLADTDYFLVEFYPNQGYSDIEEALNEIIMLGKIPVIAHLERYQAFFGRIDRVREVVKMGAYVQINTSSFIGGFFDKRVKFLKKLLQEDLIHFVGSDCHDVNSRAPMMEKAYNFLVKTAGKRQAERIVYDNPRKLTEGEYI